MSEEIKLVAKLVTLSFLRQDPSIEQWQLESRYRRWLTHPYVESLQNEINNQTDKTESVEQLSVYIPGSSIRGLLRTERTALISRMRGFLKQIIPLLQILKLKPCWRNDW